MIDVKKLLEEIKASPFEEVEVLAPHTGVVSFSIKEEGAKVVNAAGTWGEKPGTLLAVLERERNKKPVYSPQKGSLTHVETQLEGRFVEAGTKLMVIRHYLSKEEVIDLILKKVLFLFLAPERAKYYFVPDVDKKVKATGCQSVKVRDGMELFIASRMKREAPHNYSGPDGKIHTVYFKHDQNIDAGQPLIGVCPESQIELIHDVVNRVRTDWEERE